MTDSPSPASSEGEGPGSRTHLHPAPLGARCHRTLWAELGAVRGSLGCLKGRSLEQLCGSHSCCGDHISVASSTLYSHLTPRPSNNETERTGNASRLKAQVPPYSSTQPEMHFRVFIGSSSCYSKPAFSDNGDLALKDGILNHPALCRSGFANLHPKNTLRIISALYCHPVKDISQARVSGTPARPLIQGI